MLGFQFCYILRLRSFVNVVIFVIIPIGFSTKWACISFQQWNRI